MPERTCTDTTSRPHLNNHPYALQPMPYSLGPPDTQPSLGTSPLQPYTHPYCPGTHTWETTPHPPLTLKPWEPQTLTYALGPYTQDILPQPAYERTLPAYPYPMNETYLLTEPCQTSPPWKPLPHNSALGPS